MPNLFMRITDEFDHEIKNLMKIEGYISRAEFIRFTIKFYKYHQEQKNTTAIINKDYKWGEKAKLIRDNGGDDDPEAGPYAKWG